MQLHFHLDDILELQSDFMTTCRDTGALESEANAKGDLLRLWDRLGELNRLKIQLSAACSRIEMAFSLCIMGFRDVHRGTFGLLELAVKQARRPITLTRFYKYPDWVHFKKGVYGGSWAKRAALNRLEKKVVTIGVGSNNLNLAESKGANPNVLSNERLEFCPCDHLRSCLRRNYRRGARHSARRRYGWRTIVECGKPDFLSSLTARIETGTVYVTPDLDVLTAAEATTYWDRGGMRSAFLLEALQGNAGRQRANGTDVIGKGFRRTCRRSFVRRLVKRFAFILDQPAERQAMEHATAASCALNYHLLNASCRMMQV
ncbi:hypothetical protein KXR64_20985 [Brucella intermedia]|uniref:hypothetical protein n=1 Tax=Brucella TaxID=234 RepID=UPI0009465BBF|nr:hypothetical protein [Brucella intermedia]